MNYQMKKKTNKIAMFDSLKMTLASPEQIMDWSYGEVTKAETINYRTYKPEPDGLFCEKIFGPTKNFECYCGKYRKIRYKGIVCDKCGVEVTRKDVRRERLGHISLVVPVTHVWFAYGVPNKLSIVLDISHKKLLAVIYYTRYMVIEVQEELRESKVKMVNELLMAKKSELDTELDAELSALEEAHQKDIKALKKSDKDKTAVEFKLNQADHDHKQSIAKIRRDFADKANSIDEFYARLLQSINRIAVGAILTEDEYLDLSENDLIFFDARMGAEAIEELLKKLDLDAEISAIRALSTNEKSLEKKLKMIKRLQYLEGFKKNGLDPVWMVLRVIPVIPPELRPIIPLAGGKFATNDLNDLYRRIINRNNRLRRLIEIGAPDVILRNEKRMLQESVDALFDNQHRPGKPMLNGKKMPYNSLTDLLRGKKGIFRKNLLGKRVDYSARGVIVGDSSLLLHQCGLPKSVALEIFKPFVIQKLLSREIAPNVKVAKDMIDEKGDIIWDILEEVIQNKPVLLNRAPTLHKYGIQAFYPRLVEGEAIRIHPLICKAFNADFDGDQMAVHVLLTDEAIDEGLEKVMSTKNIISIANGKLLAGPSKDMVLGFFLMTNMNEVEKPRIFSSFDDAIRAYDRGDIQIDQEIIAKGKNQILHTSVGRIIFNNVLPEEYPFVNSRVGGAEVTGLIEDIKDKFPLEVVIKMLDDLKSIGFKFATDLGYSFAMADCNLQYDVKSKIKEIEQKDIQLQEYYLQGLVTAEEKKKKSVEMWNNLADSMQDEAWKTIDKNNSVYNMVESKANGAKVNVRQVITIKGMVKDSEGNWVAMPIKGNYRDGLNAFEYFVSASGGRKGVADTALRTPASGYLTRKLVDVAHDIIVRVDDCGYDGDGVVVKRVVDRGLSFADRIYGRVAAIDIVGEKGKVIVPKGEYITKENAKIIASVESINEVNVRSVLGCHSPLGVCQKCYGYDVEQGAPVEIGKAVGVIAAQSIGEPGTQFTLRTFHTGGVTKTDITQGLPRVEELLEARAPKNASHIAKFPGVASVEEQDDGSHVINIKGEKEVVRYYITSKAKKVSVSDGVDIKQGQLLFIDFDESEKMSPIAGTVKLDNGLMTVRGHVKVEETITISEEEELLIKDGDNIKAGQQITAGSVDPKELEDAAGTLAAQMYIVDEAQRVYNEQGVALSDVHFEVIVKQMARLSRVLENGDSQYLIGTLVNSQIAEIKNQQLRLQGKNVALLSRKLLGIKASSLYTESFLSAMSFQEQVRVLTSAAIYGKVDYLRGMKENVIIGHRIPHGQSAGIDDEAILNLPEIGAITTKKVEIEEVPTVVSDTEEGEDVAVEENSEAQSEEVNEVALTEDGGEIKADDSEIPVEAVEENTQEAPADNTEFDA